MERRRLISVVATLAVTGCTSVSKRFKDGSNEEVSPLNASESKLRLTNDTRLEVDISIGIVYDGKEVFEFEEVVGADSSNLPLLELETGLYQVKLSTTSYSETLSWEITSKDCVETLSVAIGSENILADAECDY